MLKIENVRQAFRAGFWLNRVEILKGISFDVPQGSIYGFLGPNGAGKTTLIHLITGAKQPVSGSLTLSGVPCHQTAARARIGYLPERPYFHVHLTGRQLLIFFGTLAGLSAKVIRERIPGVLEEVGMSHAADLELKKYSKGMLQRIGIAQAIIHDPELLVLDEPMSGLDPMGRKEIRELILKLSRSGKTIFFSTHVIPDVEMICDQVAIIQKGRLLRAGSVHSFLEQEGKGFEFFFEGKVSVEQAVRIHSTAEVRPTPSGTYLRILSTGDTSVTPEKTLRAAVDLNLPIRSFNPIRRSLEDYFEEGK